MKTGIKARLKHLLKKIDLYSPLPILYSFRMSAKEKELFDKNIKVSKSYLEFGMGGSTLRTLIKSNAKINSLESSIEWINIMREYKIVKYWEKKSRLKLVHIDIGPTKEWGHPVGNSSKELYPNYSGSIFNEIDKTALDTVLIDGRFRVACILKTILECHSNDNLVILVHDFWNRPQHFDVVLKHLSEVESVDTLGVFKIGKGLDLETVKKEYDIYKYNPS